jgi:hypothetical protein
MTVLAALAQVERLDAYTRPEVRTAATIQIWQGGSSEINALIKTLSLQIDAVQNGNMARLESLLLMQAHTLNELFSHLAECAYKQESLTQFDIMLRLALKSQNQCRSTLETLATIRNPPVIYAKQANMTNGPQQINNRVPATHTHKKNKIKPNELLEHAHGERLDTRTKTTTSGTDMHMEALAAVNRSKNP